MAVDMFLKIDGIAGESADAKHKGEIDVLAWSWGMSQAGTTHMGAGAGAGKVNVQDLSFTKYIDKATPNLMQFCCNGSHIKELNLTIRKAGKEQQEYLKITMKEAIVSSVSTGGSGGEDRLTENVTINFGKVVLAYSPQKPDGSLDAPLYLKWDIAANVGKVA